MLFWFLCFVHQVLHELHECDIHLHQNAINLINNAVNPRKSSDKNADRKEPSLLNLTKSVASRHPSDCTCITAGSERMRHGKDEAHLIDVNEGRQTAYCMTPAQNSQFLSGFITQHGRRHHSCRQQNNKFLLQ